MSEDERKLGGAGGWTGGKDGTRLWARRMKARHETYTQRWVGGQRRGEAVKEITATLHSARPTPVLKPNARNVLVNEAGAEKAVGFSSGTWI